MTIGRLNSAASSVAVPLAISVTSQAASAACDCPSSNCTGAPGAWSATQRLAAVRAGLAAAGSTKRSAGRARCSSAAACRNAGAM